MTGAQAYATTSGAPVASGRGVVATGAHRGDGACSPLPELAASTVASPFSHRRSLAAKAVVSKTMIAGSSPAADATFPPLRGIATAVPRGCGPQQVASPGRFAASPASFMFKAKAFGRRTGESPGTRPAPVQRGLTAFCAASVARGGTALPALTKGRSSFVRRAAGVEAPAQFRDIPARGGALTLETNP